jgi:hypothetical protein
MPVFFFCLHVFSPIINMSEKVIRIINIDEYHQERDGKDLVLTKVAKISKESDLSNLDLNGSTIINATVNGQEIKKLKYSSVLHCIYKNIPTSKILQNTTFNITLTDTNEKGYHWYVDLKISVQGKDATGTMKEIAHMACIGKLNITVLIKTQNKSVISFES